MSFDIPFELGFNLAGPQNPLGPTNENGFRIAAPMIVCMTQITLTSNPALPICWRCC